MRTNSCALGARETAARRTCPVAGCGAAIPRGHLMCRAHWRRVPRALQAEVNDSWRAFNRAVMDVRNHVDGADALDAAARYRLAREAAIGAVNALLKPPDGGLARAERTTKTAETP